MMKIHILFPFVDGPWGGGNQFLKALREYLRGRDAYAERPRDAGVIIFNSHHCLDDVFRAKKDYPDRIFIHRIDGPVYFIRGKDKGIDKSIFRFNRFLADGTVFQSRWSRDKNRQMGIKETHYQTVIMNAPDPRIFHTHGKTPLGPRLKLIATSWSGNIRRGFTVYEHLDRHLDFNRFEMTFVGNSPVEFKNIRSIAPVDSIKLADMLREHDIYITASRNDPCSNALIEALHCGLPAVARNDGGHPEIIGKAGALFDDDAEVITAIEKVAENYAYYQSAINLPDIDEIGLQYYEFTLKIFTDYQENKYYPRRPGAVDTALFRIFSGSRAVMDRFQAVATVLTNKNRKDLF